MRLLTFSFLRTCKYNKICIGLPLRISSFVEPDTRIALRDPSLVEISPSWKENDNPKLRSAVVRDMQLYPDFITEREENALLMELEPVLRRMRYEFDHWDNAIQGFRETERSQWSEQNSVVLSRVRALAYGAGALPGDAQLGDALPGDALPGDAQLGDALPGDALPGDALPGEALPGDALLPHVHVLDLAAAGHIKPHVDAVRFCGDVIAGLCLVSSAVMQLAHVTHAHMQVRALLARRALYVMRGVARYDFTHAVLGGAESTWRGERLPRQRRVALICRSRPRARDAPPEAMPDITN